MKNALIIIATHKKYKMPQDSIYLPLQVGAKGKESLGYERDDTGENISENNPRFCELTGLYWGWKNVNAEYIGLVHYRRHFTVQKFYMLERKNRFQYVLTETELMALLEHYDIILPSKRFYCIETLYSHYAHTHYAAHLDLTREIIKDKYPEYLKSFDKIMKQTWGYMFNMMIMKKEYLDQYCEWLFDILFELEKQIDMPELSSFQGRFYGRVSEIIFNVWLMYQCENKKIDVNRVKEIGCIHMENINWAEKIAAFLSAKYRNRKYESSF